MAKKIQQTFTNGQNDEHYKIIVVGGGLVIWILTIFCFYQKLLLLWCKSILGALEQWYIFVEFNRR